MREGDNWNVDLDDVNQEKLLIHNTEIMAGVEEILFVLNSSINPLQAVMFPGLGSGNVLAALRE